jgi:hypothetical protein
MLDLEELAQRRVELSSQRQGTLVVVALAAGLWFVPYCGVYPRWAKALSAFAAPAVSLAALSLSSKLDEQESEYLYYKAISDDKEVALMGYVRAAEEQEWINQLAPTPPAYLRSADAVQAVADGTSRQGATAVLDPFAPISFPVEDLAEQVALNSVDRQNCRTILLAAPGGTGKSNFIRACIVKTDNITKGAVDFAVHNGKEDRDENGNLLSTYCGLEKSSLDYLHSGDPSNAEEYYRRMEGITKAMDSRTGKIPLITINDEYNNSLIATEIHDEQAGTKYKQMVSTGTKLRITKGRSRLTCDWITAHTAFVQDLDINKGLQESISIIVLARGDRLEAMHSALRGAHAVVKNPEVRRSLALQFQQWEMSNQDPDVVVALTNLRGKWRLVSLPRYPDHQPEITRSAANSSTSELHQTIDAVAVEMDRERDEFAYRYDCSPVSWNSISSFTLAATGGLCCYPGCGEPAYQAHHAHYMIGDTLITRVPVPGRDLFGLCRLHHSHRAHPECAHHEGNWQYGVLEEPKEADSRNTPEYYNLLRRGWQEKTGGLSNAA